jgi:RNA polymerase sigma factor (sigma-70 family)
VLLAALMADQPDNRPSTKRRRRNAQLLHELLQRKEHLLRRQATRHAEGHDDIEDALQSAYAQFLERFRGDCEPLAWLYTTVKREAWALRRRGWRQRETSASVPAAGGELDLCDATPTDAPGPAASLERRDQFVARVRALDSLKKDERRALLLIGLGFSYSEITAATGWTHTKINRCASEGRATLRRLAGLTS